jgi:hypothetical protein
MGTEPKQPTSKGPAEWFIGDVWIDHLVEPHDHSQLNVGAVHFAPVPHCLALAPGRPDPLRHRRPPSLILELFRAPRLDNLLDNNWSQREPPGTIHSPKPIPKHQVRPHIATRTRGQVPITSALLCRLSYPGWGSELVLYRGRILP